MLHSAENHDSNLQGIPILARDFRQIRLLTPSDFRFQINRLGILHGRLFRRQPTGAPTAGTQSAAIESRVVAPSNGKAPCHI
jgi:hypothetical protein